MFSVNSKQEALDLQMLLCHKTYGRETVAVLREQLGDVIPSADPGPVRMIFRYPSDERHPMGRPFGGGISEFRDVADILHDWWTRMVKRNG